MAVVAVEADAPKVNAGFWVKLLLVEGTPKLNDGVFFSPPAAGQVLVAATGATTFGALALNCTPKLNLEVVSSEMDFDGPNDDADGLSVLDESPGFSCSQHSHFLR